MPKAKDKRGRDRGRSCAVGSSLAPILVDFRRWALTHRGLRASTVENHGRVLVALLADLGADPATYTVGALRAYVLRQTAARGRSYAKRVVAAMRLFLRYAAAADLAPPGLWESIPTVAVWRLSEMPRYVGPSEVQRIVDAADCRRPTGTRDRAILLLLSRLGLRAGEVAALRFDDIDWERGTVRVAGKTRREDLLPLPQDVGDAVLAYLKHGRPPEPDEHVFLGIYGWRPLRGIDVAHVVDRAIRRAGVEAPTHGAHLLRHSLATQMLRSGNSLQDIARVLRHRSVETTTKYAKVDVAHLRLVAQPWPQVTSC